MWDISFLPQLGIEAYVILGAVIILALFINLIPTLSYPFYLFFILIHELGHVVMIQATGGKVLGFWIFSNTSGVAKPDPKQGSDPYAMLPAGYMGTTWFSAGLILLTGLPYLAPYSLGAIGGILLLLILLFGKQTRYDNGERIPVTWTVGIFFTGLFIGVAWLAPLFWSVFLLYLLAIEGAFISLQMFGELAHQVRNNAADIDPNQMSKLAGHSPMFWVRLWTILSILILGTAIWFTWLRGLLN